MSIFFVYNHKHVLMTKCFCQLNMLFLQIMSSIRVEGRVAERERERERGGGGGGGWGGGVGVGDQ